MLQVMVVDVEGDSAHAPEVLKVPPAPPSLQVTVPVGDVGVPVPVSLTVAENVMVFPTMTVDGLGDTDVAVDPPQPSCT